MIFHSAPHMTSVFIHVSPMALTFALRWHNSSFKICEDFPECNVSPWKLIYDAMTKFYLWWALGYYVWVYLLMGNRIKSRGYKTLFDRVVSRGPTKFIVRVHSNEYVQKAAYMLTHFVFAGLTMVLAAFYWHSRVAHFVFMTSIIIASAWNASGYYFTVFVNRYEEELANRVKVQ